MLEIVIEARNAAISEAVKVKRILPFRLRRMVGPFIFMDHAGPISDIPSNPSTLDVLPHPHIGLSTVSYVFSGQVTHRDSLGVEQVISPGEVNWMTAGSGIAHSERFEDPFISMFKSERLIEQERKQRVGHEITCRAINGYGLLFSVIPGDSKIFIVLIPAVK